MVGDQTDNASDAELLLWNEGETRLLENAPPATGSGANLAYARALVDAGRWPEAIERLQSQGTTGAVSAARARGLLAYIRYYQGDFIGGVADADAAIALGGIDPVVRAEAHLHASVNLIALNDATRAEARVRLAHDAARRIPRALRPDLRFRVARQMVHVMVAAGRYLEAARYAEVAMQLGRTTHNRRINGLAHYLRGHVAAARGDATALGHYSTAIRTWGTDYESLQRWVRHCTACFLRDVGDLSRAHLYHGASGIRLVWEEPLFALAERRPAEEPKPGSSDEEPFCSATTGLIRLCRGRGALAEIAFTAAVTAFEAGGLDHFRRGAALGLAASYVQTGRIDLARDLVRDEVPELKRSNLVRWPWWHPNVAMLLARPEISGEGARLFGTAPPAGRRIGDRDESRSLALSQREREVLTKWLEHPQMHRAELAVRLGISEASLRNHINRLRRKLGVGSARGPEPLRIRASEIESRGLPL